MKTTIHRNLCNGCGLCAKICSEVFLMDVEGKAVVKVATVIWDAEQRCREGAERCPTKAIGITGIKGRKH
ncbi:MAG: ferredoxin [Fibrobacterota bacterium]